MQRKLFFCKRGGSIIMKGQRVNVSWVHLITYIEKRGKKTYWKQVDNPFSIIGILSRINKTELVSLPTVSFCPGWKSSLWEERKGAV